MSEDAKIYLIYKKADQEIHCAKTVAYFDQEKSLQQSLNLTNPVKISKTLNPSLLYLNADNYAMYWLEEYRDVVETISKDLSGLHKIQKLNLYCEYSGSLIPRVGTSLSTKLLLNMECETKEYIIRMYLKIYYMKY